MAADPLTTRTLDNLENENNFFDSDEDPFAEYPAAPPRDDKPTLSPRKRKADEDKENYGLGLDEEVKIVKKRKPIAKLDVERLLSQPGIPKLRDVVRSGSVSKKLRFKGKGHEFSDAGRLLNYYQLWLDNLYPRAKFADALQLVEKAGHQKRMHVMRRTWIDEGKPSYARDKALQEEWSRQEEADAAKATTPNKHDKPAESDIPDEDEDAIFFADREGTAHEQPRDEPDDDELDALLAQDTDHAPSFGTRHRPPTPVDSDGEDDLDALLAEHDSRSRMKTSNQVEDDQDELDALLAEHDPTPLYIEERQAAGFNNTISVDEEEGEGLGELLDEGRRVPEPELPKLPSTPVKAPEIPTDIQPLDSEEVPGLSNTISSSPIPNVQTDDLDQLMDEHEATHGTVKDNAATEHFLSSSPIPNGDSQ